MNGAWGTHGIPHQPHCVQPVFEEFETKAINTATHPPKLWVGYVDDTSVIQREEHSNQFLQDLNSIDPHIQFTQETPKMDGSIQFLDMLITPGTDNTLVTSIYTKSTHIDQYLHWQSQHNLSVKYSMFNTLTYRLVQLMPMLICYTRKRKK